MKEMKNDSSTIAWNAMGDEWFKLAQTGESRNYFIMPNMLNFMGKVTGKRILDLGCGEGGYSRELAKRGAQLVSVYCSKKAIEYATALANKENLQIEHVKSFIKSGLTIVDLNEPRANDEQAQISVDIAWLQKIPLYLYWELKK